MAATAVRSAIRAVPAWARFAARPLAHVPCRWVGSAAIEVLQRRKGVFYAGGSVYQPSTSTPRLADDETEEVIRGILFPADRRTPCPPPFALSMRKEAYGVLQKSASPDEAVAAFAKLGLPLHPAQVVHWEVAHMLLKSVGGKATTKGVHVDPVWLQVWCEELLTRLTDADGDEAVLPNLGVHHDAHVRELKFFLSLRGALGLEGPLPVYFLQKRLTRSMQPDRLELWADNVLPFAGTLSLEAQAVYKNTSMSAAERRERLAQLGYVMHMRQILQPRESSSPGVIGTADREEWLADMNTLRWATIVDKKIVPERYRVIVDLLGYNHGDEHDAVVEKVLPRVAWLMKKKNSAMINNSSVANRPPLLGYVPRSKYPHYERLTGRISLARGVAKCPVWLGGDVSEVQRIVRILKQTAIPVPSMLWSTGYFYAWYNVVRSETNGFISIGHLDPQGQRVAACLRDFSEHNPQCAGVLERLRMSYDALRKIGEADMLMKGELYETNRVSACVRTLWRKLDLQAMFACLTLRLERALDNNVVWHGVISDEEMAAVAPDYLPPMRLPYIPAWIPQKQGKVVHALWSRTKDPSRLLQGLLETGAPGTYTQILDPKHSETEREAERTFKRWLGVILAEYVVKPEELRCVTMGDHEEALCRVLRDVTQEDLKVKGVFMWQGVWTNRGQGAIMKVKALYQEMVKAVMGQTADDKVVRESIESIRNATNVHKLHFAPSWGRTLAQGSEIKRLGQGHHSTVTAMYRCYVGLACTVDNVDAVTAALQGVATDEASGNAAAVIAAGVPLSKSQITQHLQGKPIIPAPQSAAVKDYLEAALESLVDSNSVMYFGPSEQALGDYIARLGVSRRQLSFMHEESTWCAAVYSTLAHIVATGERVEEETVVEHRGLIVRTDKTLTPCVIGRSRVDPDDAMPYFGTPPREVVQLLPKKRSDKRMVKLSWWRQKRAVLDELRVPTSMAQMRKLALAEGSKEDVRTWLSWLRWVLDNDDVPAEAFGPRNENLVRAVRHAGPRKEDINEDRAIPTLAREAVPEYVLYDDLCEVLAGGRAPEDVRPFPRPERKPYYYKLLKARVEDGYTLEHMPFVGQPNHLHLRAYCGLCPKDDAPPTVLARALAEADVSGVAISWEQTVLRRAYSWTNIRRARAKRDALLTFVMTQQPLSAFRTWLAQKATHLVNGPWMPTLDELISKALAAHGVEVASIGSLADDDTLALYNEIVVAKYCAANSCPVDAAPAWVRASFIPQDVVDYCLLGANSVRMKNSKRLTIPYLMRRLPYVSGRLAHAPSVLLDIVHTACEHVHAAYNLWNHGAQNSFTRDMYDVCVVFALPKLEARGVPVSRDQLLDWLNMYSHNRVDLERTLLPMANYDLWLTELAASKEHSATARRALYGPHVAAYDEVLRAFPSGIAEWSGLDKQVAYSRMVQVSAGDATPLCELPLAPLPARLDSCITDEEREYFAHKEAWYAARALPPMPHMGLPISEEHAKLLGTRAKNRKHEALQQMLALGLPASEKQLGLTGTPKRVESGEFREWLSMVQRLPPAGHPLVDAVHGMSLRDDLAQSGTDDMLLEVHKCLRPVYSSTLCFRSPSDVGEAVAAVAGEVGVERESLDDRQKLGVGLDSRTSESLVELGFAADLTSSLKGHEGTQAVQMALGVAQEDVPMHDAELSELKDMLLGIGQ